MLNFKEIFNAWVTASSPTEDEKKLASARLDICKGCEYKREIIRNKDWALLCGQCGCPIQGKIFSDEINPCPVGYWKEIDRDFGISTDQKDKKSII